MKMIQQLLVGLFVTVISVTAHGASAELEATRVKAVAEKKDVLIVLTGPTWCGPCKRLEEEVFGDTEFSTSLKQSFVVLTSETRRDGSDEAKDLEKRHREIVGELHLNFLSYPTLVMMDLKGKVYFRHAGYRAGTGADYVKALVGVSAEKHRSAEVEELVVRAQKETGAARADLIKEAKEKIGAPQQPQFFVDSYWKLAKLDSRLAPIAAVVELRTLSPVYDSKRVIELTTLLLKVDDRPQAQKAFTMLKAKAEYCAGDYNACLETLTKLREIDSDKDAVDRDIAHVKSKIEAQEKIDKEKKK